MVLDVAAEDARECVAALDKADVALVVGARAIVSRLLHAHGAWQRSR